MLNYNCIFSEPVVMLQCTPESGQAAASLGIICNNQSPFPKHGFRGVCTHIRNFFLYSPILSTLCILYTAPFLHLRCISIVSDLNIQRHPTHVRKFSFLCRCESKRYLATLIEIMDASVLSFPVMILNLAIYRTRWDSGYYRPIRQYLPYWTVFKPCYLELPRNMTSGGVYLCFSRVCYHQELSPEVTVPFTIIVCYFVFILLDSHSEQIIKKLYCP